MNSNFRKQYLLDNNCYKIFKGKVVVIFIKTSLIKKNLL